MKSSPFAKLPLRHRVVSVPARRMISTHGAEPLESRIAPAVFLASSTSLQVLDVTNPTSPVDAMDQANEIDAAGIVGASVAFLQQGGDKLFFDTNHNGKLDGKDQLLVQVIAGDALVFLTDRDHNGVFSPNELTGLGVGSYFNGVVKTDVAGSIATILGPDKSIQMNAGKIVVQRGNIVGLNVSGVVTGNIEVLGPIENVKIGAAIYEPASTPSVNKIATGIAVNGSEMSFGAFSLTAVSAVVPFIASYPLGLDISNLTLLHGAREILASNGVDATLGKSGSITNVTVVDALTGIHVEAGSGQMQSIGGSISNFKLSGSQVHGDVSFVAGDGGSFSSYAGDLVGGDGGSISRISVNFKNFYGDLLFQSGGGGEIWGRDGIGGKEGSLSGITVKTTGDFVGDAAFFMDGSARGNQQAGLVSDVTFQAQNMTGDFTVSGHVPSMTQGTAMPGFSVMSVNFAVSKFLEGDVLIKGGDGGANQGTAHNGRGGAVEKVTAKIGAQQGSFSILGGSAGESLSGATAGGGNNGGSVNQIAVTFGQIFGNVAITGGAGSSGLTDSSGGVAGAVSGVKLVAGKFAGEVAISGGQGGSAGPLGGWGGPGGEVKDASVQAGEILNLVVSGGNGGNHGNEQVAGSAMGGSVQSVTVAVAGKAGGLAVKGGNGGEGGNGGSVTGVKFMAREVTEDVLLQGGDGGAGIGQAAGHGGTVQQATVTVTREIGSGLLVYGGRGGDADTLTAGGGGDVRMSKFSVGSILGGTLILGGIGGAAQSSPTAVAGGAGGSLTDLNLTVKNRTGSDVRFIAGRGGLSTDTVGGKGGEVLSLSIAIAQGKGVSANAGAGGDGFGHFGRGGLGGTVTGVKAVVKSAGADTFEISGGDGGASFADGGVDVVVAGAGGSVKSSSLILAGVGEGRISILGGRGGSAERGQGGIGGDVEGSSIQVDASKFQKLEFSAGAGGAGVVGGVGGDLKQSTARLGKSVYVDETLVRGGHGGNSTTGEAGLGGTVDGLIFTSAAAHLAETVLAAGQGGNASLSGSGGAGGDFRNVVAKFSGSLAASLTLGAGNGGDTSTGIAGAGGALSLVTLAQSGQVAAEAMTFLIAGDAGAAGTGTAGRGGDLTNLKVSDLRAYASYQIVGGDGSNTSTGAAGGLGGKTSVVTLAGTASSMSLFGGKGGAGNVLGGDGGSIENIIGKTGMLWMEAGRGGDASGSGGQGGVGGSVQKVNVTTSHFVQSIQAGSGGNGHPLGLGGAGGSIDEVKIGGDIGNFTRPFNVTGVGMGGLFAGLGGGGGAIGLAGGVTNVSASRIAAILAADNVTTPGNLTTANAVSQLKNIKAKVIGADVNGNGLFDLATDTGTTGFQLNTGDVSIDGLVIALTAGLDLDTIKKQTFPVIQA